MSNQIIVHYEGRDVTYKNLSRNATFKFYMKSGLVLTTPVEEMLSAPKETNRAILEPIAASFLKTLGNNAEITFGNWKCTGWDVAKIEVCNEAATVLLTVFNEGFA